jgi:DNA/RNA endonuclease G (NUC1)
MRNLLSTVVSASALFFIVERAGATIDASLQMQLGNPSGAIVDTNNHDHFLIQRTVEAIDYSDNLGEPNWASWDLTTNDVGTNSRSSFIIDTNLPPNFNWVVPGDYTDSGYDRGHLCPSKDRTDTANDNDMVFLMSNVMPQDSINNSGVWLQFENYCRALAATNELLIICGPSAFDGSRINTNGPVLIPDYVWKIAVVVPLGSGTAVSRVTNSTRVIALKIPNTDAATNTWPFYATSASQIEVDTGYTFFTALPSDVASVLRNKVDGQTNPPPVIFSFSPTNGSADTNVVITGTNFTSASAVTFNGASASYSVDSDAQITATVPANAGSGFISVTTPSGTAISTNSFTVLNSGGSVYSGVLIGWDVSGLPGGLNNYGPSPLIPNTNAPNLAIVGLTRGAGVKQSGTAGPAGWGGTGFTNLTTATAIASNQFATFSLTASNGYKMSFTAISRYDYRCSATGPTNGDLQFQVGTGAFVDLTNIAYSSAANGATNPPFDLSGISALQNVGANTNVTFRIVNYGGTSSLGNWYVFDFAGSAALDLAVQGTVTQVLTITNPSAIAPSFSSLVFTNNQFQFSITGTSGSNYVVQASTNLAAPIWIALATNAVPFQFTESNLFPQRFYRAIVAP